MPEIHDIHPLGPLEDVSTIQAREWTKLDSPGKILARPFNPLVHAQRYHDEIANDLLTAIKEITDAPRVSIGKPLRGPQVQDNPRFPMAFLIHDISANDAELLTGRKVWAGPNITFEAITFPPPRPTYLFTLRGLATSSEENIKNIVLDTWKDSTSFAFFDNIVAKFPAQFTQKYGWTFAPSSEAVNTYPPLSAAAMSYRTPSIAPSAMGKTIRGAYAPSPNYLAGKRQRPRREMNTNNLANEPLAPDAPSHIMNPSEAKDSPREEEDTGPVPTKNHMINYLEKNVHS
ncbi:hypothetical protein BGW80DRAFT_1561139 [Lactifluus volemus]|nr:hypothetical protein BGW80DRAFT_1561139 [Lactifluus volemus]